jgi:hypothetical protein
VREEKLLCSIIDFASLIWNLSKQQGVKKHTAIMSVKLLLYKEIEAIKKFFFDWKQQNYFD